MSGLGSDLGFGILFVFYLIEYAIFMLLCISFLFCCFLNRGKRNYSDRAYVRFLGLSRFMNI